MIKFAAGDRVRVNKGNWYTNSGTDEEFIGKTGTVEGSSFSGNYMIVRFDEEIYSHGSQKSCLVFYVPTMALDFMWDRCAAPFNKGDIVQYKPYSGYLPETCLATVVCAADREHYIVFFHNEGMHFLHVYHKQFHGIYGFKAHNSALSLYKPGILKMGCLVRLINNTGDLFPEFNERQGIYQGVSKLGKRFVKVKIDGEDCIVDVKNIQVI